MFQIAVCPTGAFKVIGSGAIKQSTTPQWKSILYRFRDIIILWRMWLLISFAIPSFRYGI